MRLSICLAALLLGAAPALAGPLEDGLAAYEAREFDKAVQLLNPPADKGNPDAQEKIGRLYERGKGVPKDFTRDEYWYRKAAEQGDASAMMALAALYERGKGVAKTTCRR